MKKTSITLLFLLFILLTNCSKNEGETIIPPAICPTISDLNVSQNQGKLNFSIVTTNNYEFYEISYQGSGNSPSPGNGQFFQSNVKEFTKSIEDDLGPNLPSTYVFYVRGYCSQSIKSSWKGPFQVQINSFCRKPFSLQVTQNPNSTRLSWSHVNSLSTYQVQYGNQGFTLGNGNIINTNTTEINNIPLQGNQTYEFYVRGLCDNSIGWSDWAGPLNYFSPETQNMCTAPSNLTFNNEGGGYYLATWSYNGESLFEYSITNNSSSPITNIQTIGTGGNPVFFVGTTGSKYFRVRAVCSNGNRTSWIGSNVP